MSVNANLRLSIGEQYLAGCRTQRHTHADLTGVLRYRAAESIE